MNTALVGMDGFAIRQQDWNLKYIDRLAGEKGAMRGCRFGFVIVFDIVV